ncbi:PTS IIA-like nitrogen-regulatory protein PtsN [Desulfocicer vacuolatum DSM 3385]|uniref:PTS IIA-like nitrogen-regulatory protein PtsN n=1 Tax=Desulfocicer vacuolatum DSM 3385 TaxID=1121400 RepID=A0A1W2CEL2_9BACT|nr:PTS sugar transporter subunit IIA [Desulfocicer vacuolatum]SMC83630.1 PTS IIA-like nitrogen-regulatory protein PtsN [Desulfocicer vacuolatum DSM 3385]
MKISEILHRSAIIADLKSNDKKGVLEELAAAVSDMAETDSQQILKVLLEREQLGSTGIGGGIGIPHGKLNAINSIVVGFGLSRGGVDFDSLDNKPVHIFFLLITPENSTGSHLKVLAQISRLLKQSDFKDRLMKAETVDDIVQIIHDVDDEF